ncbi:MAG: hypothetical protein IMZ52_04745 [Actinobacteria bacterium]|nr:hypothetical protein [Actinomycetota bacterium]MBE3114773.1 hypothetical protein [Actinomycetota bacterium]
MKNINQNEIAKVITLAEGKKINLSIGQCKEVIHLTLEELAKYEDEQILKLINKHRKD